MLCWCLVSSESPLAALADAQPSFGALGRVTGADVWSLAAMKLNNSRLTVINEYDVTDNSRMHEFDARLLDED